MKNWRTTVAGLLAGLPFVIDALINAYNAGLFTEKTGLQLFGAIAIIIWGVVSKDAKVSGTDDKEKMEGLIGLPKPKTNA